MVGDDPCPAHRANCHQLGCTSWHVGARPLAALGVSKGRRPPAAAASTCSGNGHLHLMHLITYSAATGWYPPWGPAPHLLGSVAWLAEPVPSPGGVPLLPAAAPRSTPAALSVATSTSPAVSGLGAPCPWRCLYRRRRTKNRLPTSSSSNSPPTRKRGTTRSCTTTGVAGRAMWAMWVG